MRSTIRTRIAPSPTGLFHIGTARAALFNYLYAKKNGGQFILRIEDTDKERSKKEFEDDIFNGLSWLGIIPDEGPKEGGMYGPYRQSERLLFYVKAVDRLLAEENAYYCFHDDYYLEQEKKRLLAEKKPPIHECEYRELSLKEAEQKKETLSSFVIRFKSPKERTVAFKDHIRGPISFQSDLLGDFSIARDVAEPLYNLAVVVDDHEMNITHVIRGEDHISNTPKQILIAEALSYPLPEYAHLPLILGADRAKLSKRHGATSVADFRAAGYLPDAMVNFMAFLGWNPGDEREFFLLSELENEFSLEHVQKSGAVFNEQKLDSINSFYVKKRMPADLMPLILPMFEAAQFPTENKMLIESIIAIEQPRVKKLTEVVENAGFFFALPEYGPELLIWKDNSLDDVKRALKSAVFILDELPPEDFTPTKLDAAFTAEIAVKFKNKGDLLWPLRVALSGQKTSPGPYEIISALGKEESLRRINEAIQKITL